MPVASLLLINVCGSELQAINTSVELFEARLNRCSSFGGNIRVSGCMVAVSIVKKYAWGYSGMRHAVRDARS